jgi:pimeloyl-ACP methyl ester carboxylesterase
MSVQRAAERLSSSLNRRALTTGLLGASLLGGCSSFIEDVFSSCPTEPSEVDWIVDIAHPVFFGVEAASGSSRPLTIYYPSATRDGALLQPCLQRWPIVLFLHGMPPREGRPTSPWASVWTDLPATIARSGYVVAVPSHNAQQIESDAAAAVAAAMADIEWVRNAWSGSATVDKRASSTVLAGHSYGALIAARAAAAHEVGALVSLSGPYILDGASRQALKEVRAPSFFMWGDDDSGITSQFDDLDQVNFWANELTQDRYAAVYDGEHFDYVDAIHTGGAPRGPCAHVGPAAADLAALFIAANIASLTRVGVDLRKPQAQLTMQQQAFAEGHLEGLDQFAGPGCRMTLRWAVGGESGGRQFGLP